METHTQKAKKYKSCWGFKSVRLISFKNFQLEESELEKNTTSTGTQVLVVRKGRKSVVCDLVMFNTSVGMISEFFFLPSKLAPLNVVQCRWFKFSSLRCACFSEKILQNLREILFRVNSVNEFSSSTTSLFPSQLFATYVVQIVLTCLY